MNGLKIIDLLVGRCLRFDQPSLPRESFWELRKNRRGGGVGCERGRETERRAGGEGQKDGRPGGCAKRCAKDR